MISKGRNYQDDCDDDHQDDCNGQLGFGFCKGDDNFGGGRRKDLDDYTKVDLIIIIILIIIFVSQ